MFVRSRNEPQIPNFCDLQKVCMGRHATQQGWNSMSDLFYHQLKARKIFYKFFIPFGEFGGNVAPWQLEAPVVLRKLKLPVFKNCILCTS